MFRRIDHDQQSLGFGKHRNQKHDNGNPPAQPGNHDKSPFSVRTNCIHVRLLLPETQLFRMLQAKLSTLPGEFRLPGRQKLYIASLDAAAPPGSSRKADYVRAI